MAILKKCDENHLPDPYKVSSLWILPSSPGMLLWKQWRRNGQFDRTALWKPRVFIWIPHLLCNNIPCPHCSSSLSGNGIAHDPRPVYDLEDNFYIVGWRYRCRKENGGCGKTFQSWNSKVLACLPESIMLEFPAILSHRAGISHRVLNLQRSVHHHGMGPDPVRRMFVENRLRRHDVCQRSYLEAIYGYTNEQGDRRERLRSSGLRSLRDMCGDSQTHIFDDYSTYEDPQGFGGTLPSSNYLQRMYCKFEKQCAPVADQFTSMLPVQYLAGDGSQKVWSQTRSSLILGHHLMIIGITDHQALGTHQWCPRLCRDVQCDKWCSSSTAKLQLFQVSR